MDGVLKDKIALVTGAGRGIGRSIALELSHRGAHVIVNYHRSAQGAQQVVDEIRSNGGRAIALQADVSRADQVEKMFSAIKEQFGRLDILVNNAGQITVAPLMVMTEEEWYRILDVNAKAVWLCARAAVPLMKDRGGAMVNISSEVAHRAFPGGLIYSASKAALEMITKVLAVELAPLGIVVNGVAPGLTHTDMGRPFIENDEIRRAALNRTPVGRLGEPEDIAKVVAFLVSPDAYWLRGQILMANGGGSL